MEELSIYKIEDDLQGEVCELALGTLLEVYEAYKLWIEEHFWDGENGESIEDYPKAKLFYDNPKKWIDKYGDNGQTDIYFGWKLYHIYTFRGK